MSIKRALNIMEANKFNVDGFRVLIKKDELEKLRDVEYIRCSNIVKSECPVVAEGDWTEDGIWLFFKTYSENSDYSFEFNKFMKAVEKGRAKF